MNPYRDVGGSGVVGCGGEGSEGAGGLGGAGAVDGDGVVVDLVDGLDVAAGAGEEDLVGGPEGGHRDVLLDGVSDLEDEGAGHAGQAARGQRAA